MSPLDRRKGARGEPYKRPLGQARLYLDDLDNVIHYLLRFCNAVQLQAGDSIASNGASDLVSAKRKELRSVAIFTTNPSLTIRLGQPRAFAITTENNDRARRLVDDVVAMMARHYRVPIAAPSRFYIAAALSVVSLLSIIRMALSYTHPFEALISNVPFLIFTLIVLWRFAHETFRHGSVSLRLTRRSDKSEHRLYTWRELFIAVTGGLVVILISQGSWKNIFHKL